MASPVVPRAYDEPAGDLPEGRDSWLLWNGAGRKYGNLGSEKEANGMFKDPRDQ